MTVEALTRPFVGTDSRALRRHAPLAAVLAVAAVLNGAKLAQNGFANQYYAGAVRSMMTSWHNFFFASFDQGGLVSVDKPPLALWAEAASAKVFGFSGVTILLPEAIAGVLAVWLLYLLVARYFGRAAGLVAALALAVSPVSVAVNRDNNPDALFALLLIAAVWAAARAVESGRLRWLLASAVLTGLAFNTKMLAAGIIVPGIALGYLFCARLPWGKRIGHLLVAGIPLALVSSAWIAAVQLTPAADRPYVGSTSDNSALSLALGYNGLGRVLGQSGGTSFGGGGGGGTFSGTPGFFRLINDALGDQGGWLLPLAIVGGVSAFVYAWRFRRVQLGPLVMLGGWFVAGAVVFSYSSGIVHTYYLSALAPATSALVGIGTVSLARDAKRGDAWIARASLRGAVHRVARGRPTAADGVRVVAAEPRRLRRVHRSSRDRGARGRAGLVGRATACDRIGSARDRSRRLPRATGRVVGDRASGRGERCLPRCRTELHLGPRRLVVDARPRLRRWRLRSRRRGQLVDPDRAAVRRGARSDVAFPIDRHERTGGCALRDRR